MVAWWRRRRQGAGARCSGERKGAWDTDPAVQPGPSRFAQGVVSASQRGSSGCAFPETTEEARGRPLIDPISHYIRPRPYLCGPSPRQCAFSHARGAPTCCSPHAFCLSRAGAVDSPMHSPRCFPKPFPTPGDLQGICYLALSSRLRKEGPTGVTWLGKALQIL